MSEEEKAIETLKEVASDDFDTLGDDISTKMAQNILNVIEKQQKEIEKYEQQIDLEFVEKNFIDKNKVVSKDKIREKIKKAKEIKWHTPKLVIEYFEELLEEY